MVTTEREVPTTQLLSGEKLAKLGVQIRNRFVLELECMRCQETWSPRRHADGTLPHGYWKCPHRCNW